MTEQPELTNLKKIEEEMRQRKERVEQWRKQKSMSIDANDENNKSSQEASWSLDNDADDEPHLDGNVGTSNAVEEDPLDAFMANVKTQVQELIVQDQLKLAEKNSKNKKREKLDDDDIEDKLEQQEKAALQKLLENEDAFSKRMAKRKDILSVDHGMIEYEPFRKDFYIEVPEVKKIEEDDVSILREKLDGIKVRGVNCPKPVLKWNYCGFNLRILEVIKKLGFAKPTPIQSQAMPAIMSGRDVIGVAKTGSGKTLAFLLPMFRHIMDQRPLQSMEGPIGLILTPTRELATQIMSDCRKFTKSLDLRVVCAYGGAPIKDNIADLKRGAEIIVCTPGRIIDLLCANAGRVTNLRRLTFLVLDEADRMFDMGFEPQVTKIIQNTRPDRQTVLFSATFPRQMEALAKSILIKPIEIIVGGRSVVCNDVKQIVEVRDTDSKFLRLLEILGQEYDNTTRVLIFVDKQDSADTLLRDLMRRGYPCMALHGGKDQLDRDSIIHDFKSGVVNLLVATSVAARGLDVKELKLVINYDCPNHYEDYIHRVGRTGRAGRKGTAITFITHSQEKYAPDLVRALKLSNMEVPEDLSKLAQEFKDNVQKGNASYSGRGYGGQGLERMNQERESMMKAQKIAYGETQEDESDEEIVEVDGEVKGFSTATNSYVDYSNKKDDDEFGDAVKKSREAVEKINQRIKDHLVATLGREVAEEVLKNSVESRSYSCEVDINDYPQQARWKVTTKENCTMIYESCRASMTIRGTFVPPGKQPKMGQRRLYVLIEADSEYGLLRAKGEVKRILNEATMEVLEMSVMDSYKYGF